MDASRVAGAIGGDRREFGDVGDCYWLVLWLPYESLSTAASHKANTLRRTVVVPL